MEQTRGCSGPLPLVILFVPLSFLEVFLAVDCREPGVYSSELFS